MAIVLKKIKRPNGKEYYNLVDVRRVNGKVVMKYVGYLGKSPKSIQELTPEQLLPYVRRLIDTELTDVEMQHILKKMGVVFGAILFNMWFVWGVYFYSGKQTR